MVFRLAAPLLCAFALFAAPSSARELSRSVTSELRADGSRVTTTTIVSEVIEEWDAASGGGERAVDVARPHKTAGLAQFGPFTVIDERRAAFSGITDSASPAAFRRMLAAYPALDTLEFGDCAGTFDDRANLQVARMIRDAGLTTHVPASGSVRSGAVELFLGGAERRIDDGAEFAVHAWEDEDGLQASDYALGHEQNAKYLAFYRAMGMSESDALAFYAMTNSVRHEDALWLDAADMRGWLHMSAPEPALPAAAPAIAYLDLGELLN